MNSVGARTACNVTVAPLLLGRLVATVPDDELSKAREVVATVERRGEEARTAAAEQQAKEAEALRYLLSG